MDGPTTRVPGWWLAGALLVLLHALTGPGATAAGAENLIVFDGELTVTKGTHGWPLQRELPADWTAPVDYSQGAAHFEWEILEAPKGAEEMVLQLGWKFPGGGDRPYQLVRFGYQKLLKRMFRDRALIDELPGDDLNGPPNFVTGARYHTIHVMNSGRFWWPLPEKEPKDYSKGIAELFGFVRAKDWSVTGPPGPVRIRLKITLVPPGGNFTPQGRFGEVAAGDLKHLPEVAKLLIDEEPGEAYRAAERIAEKGEGEAKAEAATVVAGLTAYAEAEKAAIAETRAEDPVGAVTKLEHLAESFGRAPFAKDFKEEAKAWTKEKAYKNEEKAARYLEKMEKAAAPLRKMMKDRGLDAEALRKSYRSDLRKVERYYDTLREKYESTAARKKADPLAAALGLDGD